MPGEWRNWTGDQRCSPAVVERPRTLEGLIEAVRRAADRGLTVHAAGSGHSFTEAALTDGAMLRIEALNRVLDADTRLRPGQGRGGNHPARPQRGALGARAGDGEPRRHRPPDARRGDLDRDPRHRRRASATSRPRSRRSSWCSPTEACSRSPSGPTATRYRAARVGLGALGVIYSVTLRAVPAFTLHRVDAPRPLEETLASLDELAARNDHFEFFVFPYTDTALTIERNRTDGPPRPRGPRQRLPERDRARELRHGRCCRGSGAASLRDPAAGRLCRAPVLAHREDRPQLPGLRLRAPRPVHRDGVRDPARARAGGGAPGARAGARAPATRSAFRSSSAWSPPTTRCSAPPTSARPPTSPSTSTRGWTGSPTSRRSRRSCPSTAAARTGASATSRPPRRWRSSTRAGATSSAVRARLDPEGRFAQRLHGPRPGPGRLG